MTTALLIIDVQQAMCTGDDAAFDIDRVIDRINLIAAGARSAGLPVVLIQHQEDEGPLQPGSDGWQLAERLHAQPDDLRVHKTTPDSFHRTELHPLLQSQDVQRLVVCGLQTEYCVDTTVRRALALGYEVLLVADAHSTMDNGVLSAAQIVAHTNTTLAGMSSFGPRVAVKPAREVAIAA
jgi:nicotinamidase-related amidase